MGCAASCIQQATMSLFGRYPDNDTDNRAKLERKLYLAKESPEPEFDLSDCELREVPSGIFSICKVYRKERLYLHENNIRSLEGGGQLQDLYMIKLLNISCNSFRRLPGDIKYLVNITELYIQDNQIKSLPDTIQFLQCLQILDVSKNCLKCLTPAVGELKKLRKLKLNENKDLNELCVELCLATNLILIDLDIEQFTFPPQEILIKGTPEIMKFLCEKLNTVYIDPLPIDADMSSVQSPINLQDPFSKMNTTTWEEQEAAIKEQEFKLHEAAKQQREKFLCQVLQEQTELDAEISKVHEARDLERQRLIKAIQNDERQIECLVRNFIQSSNLDPDIIQQQLAYEQSEHHRLLEITRQNYDDVRKADVLKAMESLIQEDYYIAHSKKEYEDSLHDVKQNMLIQELESSEKLEQLLKTKDQTRTDLVLELLEDINIQKAVVASLLEKVDAKSWSLAQEISLISSHLARLSLIEQEKKKLQVEYNYNELLHQRIQLVNLLDDLFQQKHKRRNQLLETIKEMETENDSSSDFWLKNYQKLMESTPKLLLDVTKNLDPLFANCLLQHGVIHCLPFLVKFIFSGESLLNITLEDLKQSGVSFSSDRNGIIRAINDYVGANNYEDGVEVFNLKEPSAPSVTIEEQNCTGIVSKNDANVSPLESECVICMDQICEIVFVPCGHMCCCQSCGDQDMELCPMCRGTIERKIKVMVA